MTFNREGRGQWLGTSLAAGAHEDTCSWHKTKSGPCKCKASLYDDEPPDPQPCQVTKDRIGDAKARKAAPLFSGVMKYFPDALLALAELSRIGNDQHNPGKPLHWDRSKSGDELDALARHLVDAGTIDTDGVRHSTKVLWRAAANLQKEIEAEKKTPWLTEKDRT